MPEIIIEKDISGEEYVICGNIKKKIRYSGRNNRYCKVSWPKKGSVWVHRLIMEYHIGRPLLRSEHVHHKDGNGRNNSVDNLEIINGKLHNSIHTTKRNLKHDPNTFVCSRCSMSKPHKAFGICGNCWAKDRRKIKAKRPCIKCSRETIIRGNIDGFCNRCASNRFSSCAICNRTIDQLPKHIEINSSGVCRSCKTRIDRQSS